MPEAVEEKSHTVEMVGSTMTAIDVGRGEAVVLGHGYLFNAEMWRAQIDELSRHHRVIAPHLWGHGSSGPLPRHTKDLRDIALHHLLLLDRLGVDRFALVGHSLGGMWGAELACLAPERVTALVFLDSFVGSEPNDSRERYLAMLGMVKAAQAFPDELLDGIVPLFFSPEIAKTAPNLPRALRTALRTWDRDRLQDTVLPIGRMIFERRDGLKDLSRFRSPALVMTGAEDIPRPPSEGRKMAEILDCRFIELAGAGHLAPIEAPEAVTAHLLAFLSETLL